MIVGEPVEPLPGNPGDPLGVTGVSAQSSHAYCPHYAGLTRSPVTGGPGSQQDPNMVTQTDGQRGREGGREREFIVWEGS